MSFFVLKLVIPIKGSTVNMVKPIKASEQDKKTEDYGDFLQNLHGIHMEEGLHYCMNKPQVYYEVLKAFAKQQLEEVISEAWDKRNIKDYTIYIHSLKSSARNIGADILSDMAKELEFAVKNNDIEYLEQHHHICMEEYRKIYNMVKNAIDIQEKAKAKELLKTRKLSLDEFADYKDRLIESLQNMDPVESKKILDELMDVDFTSREIQESMQKIYEKVEDYDFEEAELILVQIKY